MERKEFYINTIEGQKTGIFPKVQGYMEIIEYNGREYKIGYHKTGAKANTWSATELSTGLKCCIRTDTRQAVSKWVRENIGIFEKGIRANEKYAAKFREFINRQNFNGEVKD